jgi:glutamine amidotransferase
MITLVDYGLGNIQAILNIYKRLNIQARAAATAADLESASKLILPGVGAFDWAMTRLADSGMRAMLDDLVLRGRCPVLGICVGMQMMAKGSEEGQLAGLGWIDAEVKRFDESRITQKTHLPHMGWNDIGPRRTDCLFHGMESGARAYFLHSYYFEPRHAEDVIGTTDYFGPFASAVRHDNVFGAQFHPEKSHQWGIGVLKNFAEL